VTVEGIPVFRKVALFAGRHRNEGLGRLVSMVSGSSAASERAGDSGCPEEAEEGNAVGLRHFKRRHRTQARDTVACVTGRVLRSVLRPVRVDPRYTPSGQPGGGEALLEASRLGKPAQAGGTSTGVVEADVARLAAHHRSRTGEGVVGQNRKVVEAIVPARIRESGGLVARTS
jgi:hypothetical protein